MLTQGKQKKIFENHPKGSFEASSRFKTKWVQDLYLTLV